MAASPVAGGPDGVSGLPPTGTIPFWGWLLFFLAGFPLFWLLWLSSYGFLPAPVPPRPTIDPAAIVTIPRSAGLSRISDILADSGVIAGDPRFVMLARLLGHGQGLQAGEYLLPFGQSPYRVMSILAAGEVYYRPVTIPEGNTVEQAAAILAADGWVDKERFLGICRDSRFIKSLGLDVASLEGYLFPDTYLFSRGQQNEAGIVKAMVARFMEVVGALDADSVRSGDLTLHEIITLASIVEKETAQPGERPLVARVFLNRLQRNMRLQADPTVGYGRLVAGDRLTRHDLQEPTPYNTYLIRGLPPGPIANPGRASIEAVLRPAAGRYLYFVSKNDGSHHFSLTLAEHNRAVARYQSGE